MSDQVTLDLSFTFSDADSKEKFETSLKGWVKHYEREETIYRLLLNKENNLEIMPYMNFISGW
jgi:hypothetical protein